MDGWGCEGSVLNIHYAGLEVQGRASPTREDLSIEFTRLLGAASEGGSTVAECYATASRIDFSDDYSWYREWTRIADTNRERGDAALRNGHLQSARSNWLRAMNYYQAAAFPFDRSERSHEAAIAAMRGCAQAYLQHLTPRGETVVIPWLSHYPLEGYFVPAPGAFQRRPAVICIGEPGQRKEECLFKVARHASERGMSLLAVDLMGQGTGADFDDIVGRRDLETAVGHVMDYLCEREDVDDRHIAIIADGWGSSFVARGIAHDERFAAAVCDGGIWDLQERAFLKKRERPNEMANVRSSRVARNIKCPILITAGERGWLDPDRVTELYGEVRGDCRDSTLKIFTRQETAAAQGHADNPTLANEFIFDWLEARLAFGRPA